MMFLGMKWLGGRDSNRDNVVQTAANGLRSVTVRSVSFELSPLLLQCVRVRSGLFTRSLSHRVSGLNLGALCSARARSGDDSHSFSSGSFHQTAIERDERDNLGQLTLQVEAACELYGVTRTQRMPQEQRTSVRRDLRNHLDDREGRQIALQGVQHSVATRGREHSLARTTGDPGCNFHLG